MDQNSTNYGGANGGSSSLGSGTDSMGVTGAGAGQGSTSGGYTPSQGGSQGTGGQQGGAQSGQLADKLNDVKGQAADRLSQAKDMANERLGQATAKAGELKSTLADKLDQGAQALRQQAQGGSPQPAGANGATLASNEQVQRLAAPTANAMEKTADFLRNGDLRGAVEEQVRTNPGRTLLIALGVGYVVGKAIRR